MKRLCYRNTNSACEHSWREINWDDDKELLPVWTINKGKTKVFFFIFFSFFPLLAHLGTLYKDVGGALCVDPVPVEVVRLEELGPELLLTKHKDGCQHEHLETVRQ